MSATLLFPSNPDIEIYCSAIVVDGLAPAPRSMGVPEAPGSVTACTVCRRAVFAAHVDDEGCCVFCRLGAPIETEAQKSEGDSS